MKRKWAKRLETLIEKMGDVTQLAARMKVAPVSIYRWRRGQNPSKMAQRLIENLEQELGV